MCAIGIDVAKYHRGALGSEDNDRIIVAPFRFSNAYPDLTELHARLQLRPRSGAGARIHRPLANAALQLQTYRPISLPTARANGVDSYASTDFLRIRLPQTVIVPYCHAGNYVTRLVSFYPGGLHCHG